MDEDNSDLRMGLKMTWAESLKVMRPIESLGLSLEMSILMASIDRESLDLYLLSLKPF